MGPMTTEPTIADVLTRIDRVDTRLTNLVIEVTNLRADVASMRLDTVMRLTTLFDELAAFRGEYNDHTHE